MTGASIYHFAFITNHLPLLRDQQLTVQDYIDSRPENQRAIMTSLDQLILEYPKVISKLRYKIPFYYQKSWICYLNPIRDQGVELVFIRANELSNEQGILDAKGRKQGGRVGNI